MSDDDKREFNEEDARRELEEKSKTISSKDVEELLEREEEIEEKFKKVPGRFVKLINQVKLLLEMIKDYWKGVYREIPWYTIAMAAAAIAYFLVPTDLIPDVIPVLGYVDDAAVMALAIQAIQGDLQSYCSFKGYEPEQYF